MLSFAYPWLVLALPLPLAIFFLLPAYAESRPGLQVPFFARLVSVSGGQPRAGAVIARRSLPRWLLLGLCWCLALGATMRPQWIEPPIRHEKPARDLLVLVDLSGSMDTNDFALANGTAVDRLRAVKQVLDDFLARREGDRVGVVVFGDAPFTLVPFTTDLDLCRQLVQEMEVGMAGPRTVFGDAIGLGINLFDKSTAPARTMIALTDGNDTASSVPPAEAARIARDKGIVIYTIAIGDPSAAGEEKLDEDALRDVAQVSGGNFYQALDRAELARIYDELDRIETRKVEVITVRPRRDLYWVPLALLTLLSMAAQGVFVMRRLGPRSIVERPA